MTTEQTSYYTLDPHQVLQVLESGPQGLSPAVARQRLERFGPNELAAGQKISPCRIFFRQFQNILMVILILAIGISFWLGETLDALVILAILLACVVLGFVQEYRAEKAATALQKMAAPTATVVREGQEQVIPAREVVPGDMLVLHTGDRVAADGRLLEQVNLMADESILTGESTAVTKGLATTLHPQTPVADRTCMVFSGTVITYGRGRALVTATGMDSEFGQIARLLAAVQEEKTPLEARMDSIGRGLSLICLAVSVLAMLLGVWRGYGWLEMLIWGISLAVAAVPEALPAVVTGALAIGTTRMARRHAIIKRLPAVETMGCTTVICTDKTGTLTKNEMMARRLFLGGRELEVDGSGYTPVGAVLDQGREVDANHDPVLDYAGRILILCNDAVLAGKTGAWRIIGDPTEGALLVLGRKLGRDPAALTQEFPRVAEIPFDAERQRMSTLHQDGRSWLMCVKGAPENLLTRCSQLLRGRGEDNLTDPVRQEILGQAHHMAESALRVLGLAYKRLQTIPDLDPEQAEVDLIWVGLVGLIDPPRPETAAAVAKCHRAGIKVVMVTGDHPDTAAAIGREIGLIPAGSKAHRVIRGQDLAGLDDLELQQELQNVTIFARVAPEHKLRLVNLLKARQEVVAMTGDGVNDAPALKRADIGVAMGITGAEVTKETAAMILADDNFASLVAAVEEGRAIFDNIKKYLLFLLSANLAEILVLTGSFFLGMPLPLIALQILWVNLTTDGLPALALGVDPKAPDIMSRPPRPVSEGVFTPRVIILLAVIAGYKTLALIPLFYYYYHGASAAWGNPDLTLIRAQTMVFITLVLAELVNAFNCRSDYHSLFTLGVFRNRFLVGAGLVSLLMMVAVIEWEPFSGLFHTTPLGLTDWLVAVGVSLTMIPVVELTKWLLRRQAGAADR